MRMIKSSQIIMELKRELSVSLLIFLISIIIKTRTLRHFSDNLLILITLITSHSNQSRNLLNSIILLLKNLLLEDSLCRMSYSWLSISYITLWSMETFLVWTNKLEYSWFNLFLSCSLSFLCTSYKMKLSR
jgi:hypothetical protein